MALLINDENFDEIVKTDLPVMVDFGATWCGPCQHLAPIVEELATEYEGKAVIGKNGQTILMVTHSVKAASHANRILFIKDGVVKDKSVGLVAKETLVEKLTALM